MERIENAYEFLKAIGSLDHFMSLVIGIRADDKRYCVGEGLKPSHDWDMEKDCSSSNLLDGTCALSDHFNFLDGFDDEECQEEDRKTLEMLMEMSKIYQRRHTYLIGGYRYEYGYDEKEVIIEDAKVLAIIN